uniref:DnaJ subfamily C member 7 n=1 Tax=Anthurium amnicola TaxID=1678845 RepID=A0A1D1YKX2_9ARAE
MSPALVDFRAHSAAASSPGTLPKKTSPPRNPRVGGSVTPFSSDRPRVPTAGMDPEGGAGRAAPPPPPPPRPGVQNLESVFSMLFPSPKVGSAPPSSGLSKPRFAKTRRHFPSPRVRPGSVVAADSEDAGDPGFNPFRWVPPSARVPAEKTGCSGSDGLECAESDSSGFVFRGDLNLGRGDTAVASTKDAGHSTGSSTPSHLKSSAAGDTGNASLKFATVGSTVSSAGVFGFGTRADSSYFDGNMASTSRVPDEIERNADLFGNMKEADSSTGVDQKQTFIFLRGHNLSSSGVNSVRKLPEVAKATDTGRGTAFLSEISKEEGMCSSAGGFMFGNSSKKGIAADGFDKSATAKLPQEMQKLNTGGSGYADITGRAKAADQNLEAGDDGAFVFGTNKVVLGSSGESNVTEGAFVFGSSLKKCSVPDLNSTDGLDENSVGKLPEEIQKLDIKDASLNNWSTETENVGCKFTTAGCSISGAKKIPDASTFDFSSMVKHSHFDENMTSRLPDEMRKLNLEVPSGFEKMKGPGNSKVDQKKTFVLGSNLNSGSSHKNFVSALPEELTSVNSRKDTAHQPENGKEEDMHSSAGVFMFGSSSKKSTVSDQNAVDGFEKSTAAGKLPEDMQKLNIIDSGDTDIGKARIENDGIEASGGGFVFGSGKNVSGSFGVGDVTAGVSVFGSTSKKSNVPDLCPFDGPDKSSMTDKYGISASGSNEIFSGSFGESNPSASCFVFGSSSMQGRSCDRGTFDGFDRRTVNKLPDEMQKLNIRGLGNGSTSEKTKGDDHSSENSAFVFGNKKDLSASSGESDSISGAFVFGGSSNRSTACNQGTADWFDKGKKLTDELQNLNIRGSMDSDNLEKTKRDDHNSMANDTGAFISGSNKNISASCSHDYSTTSTSIPLRFSFHTINQDGISSVSGGPPEPTDYFAGPAANTNAPSCSSSFGPSSQLSGYEFSFTGCCEGQGTPNINYRTTKQDASGYSKDGFVSGSCQSFAFNVKNGVVGHSRSKKRRSKSRGSATHYQKGFISSRKSSQVNPELDSPEDYSPMDFSPCQLETSLAEECSREASGTSGDSIHFNSHPSFTDTRNSVPVGPRDEELVHATERLVINEEHLKYQPYEGEINTRAGTDMAPGPSFVEEHASGLEYKVFPSKEDTQSRPNSTEAGVNAPAHLFGSEFGEHAGGSEFTFASCSNGIDKSRFSFSAIPSTQGSFSASKHSHRRKFRTKVGHVPFISNPGVNVKFSSPTAQLFPDVSISSQMDSTNAQARGPSVPQCSEGKRLEINKKPEVKQESISIAAASIAAKEACEKWRLRGNQAYANGDLSKAEEYYTRGVNSINPDETSRSCHRALMLCYSNRAASRMSTGRIREALCDCMMAAAIDSDFLRAKLRAANCHLLLGEIEEACSFFKACLPKGNELRLDLKFVSEATDGLQRAKQVADYMEQAAALLQKRTTNNALSAIQIITEALSLSTYSESLVEMKARSLLMLRRYDELIQLCDQTLDSAERNSSLCSADDQFKDGGNSSRLRTSPARAWRSYLKAKAYFCSGRLEEAVTSLQENEKVEDNVDRTGSKSDSLTLLSSTVRELIRLKIAGNTAFKAGRHSEAVEHYTTALAYNIESHPFAAVCFCNRAATYQALGQITDAISDCSLAIALDPNYPKAISRRATLHEMIRDYGQASNDLCRLVSLLESKLEDNSGCKRSTSNGDDPEVSRLRLAKVEEKARKEIPLDMYMILGIEPSSDAVEIRKAYRKAALRHHPDKAGHFLARSENTDEGLWKQVADEVHRDADHLFKVIGEAYAVLSDRSKRLQYDAEEEIRNSPKGNGSSNTSRTQPDFHGTHFERSNSRWQSRDHWKSYGSSNQRWSGSYQTNRYF